MKPTNDERREVAAKLREPFDVLPQGRYYHAHYTLFGMGLYASSEGALRLGVRRLADLIDPTDETCEVETCEVETCEAELTDVLKVHETVREYECSKCGMSWETVWAYDYGYCPYCGRMIVNADE